MTLHELLNEHYAATRLNLGAPTLRQMNGAIRRLDTSRGKVTTADELSAALIVSHLKWMRERNYSARQVNVRRGYLMTLWRFAYKHGFNSNDPARYTVDTVREPKTIPVAWSVDQINAMLEQAKMIKPKRWYYFAAKEWEALILLLYYTGLRITTALQLRRTSLQGRMLFVPACFQKDNEELLIRLPDDLVNKLVALYRPNAIARGRNLSEMLIPWPWGLSDPQKRLTNHILKPAGLPKSHLLKFHAFRRTTATVIAATAGKTAAQEILGHSSSKVTERYLADPATVDPSLAPNFTPMDVMPRLRVS